METELQV
jgi:hypothetical protein